MEMTKIKLNLTHSEPADEVLGTPEKIFLQTRGTITLEPGDRLKRLLEIVDGIDPEQVKKVFRTVGGFLGIQPDTKDSSSEVNIEGDDDDDTDSEPSPDRAANLV